MTPIQAAKAQLLLRTPFFGTLLLTTPLVETTDVPTAATDMEVIYWNPQFFAKLTVQEVMFVLAHEVMHIALMHGMRQFGRNQQRWNYACDYAINLILVANKLVMPKPPNHPLYSKAYAGLSAEAIYAKLPLTRPPEGGAMSNDLLPAKPNATPDRVRGKVAQAATAARLTGRMPADLDQLVTKLLHPQAPWPELLRHYATLRCTTRADWGRRNKRFPSVYLPSKGGHKPGRLGAVFDTSGSITQSIRDAVAAEITSIAADAMAEEVCVKYANTKTVREDTFKAGEPIVLRQKGGGGTDMRVPIAEFERADPPVECIIVLTDGKTPWPTAEPSVPLIVCCTTDVPVPVGHVVRIEA